MRGWKERRRARRLADADRGAIRAARRAHLAGGAAAPEAAEPPEAPGLVDLDALSWNELRAVAKRVRGCAVRNKADALAAIEAADEAAFRAAFRDVTERIIHGADR